MRLLEVGIKNFKSLRDVTFKPGDLNVLIGPNGAGKSNLVEALDFIGEMHRSGLNAALTSHGGYANVVYRGVDGAQLPISLSVTAALSKHELRPSRNGKVAAAALRDVVVRHRVTIGPGPSGSGEPYRIDDECFRLDGKIKSRRSAAHLLEIVRSRDGVSLTLSDIARHQLPILGGISDEARRKLVRSAISTDLSVLLPSVVEPLLSPTIPVSASLGAIGVYRVVPDRLRQPGIPTLAPWLGQDGSDLPAVLRWLETHHLQAFHAVVNGLCVTDMSIENLEVVDNAQGTIELVFQEAGPRRRWSARQISEGALRALGLLAALFDPRTSVVVVQEPERSLHAWAIWQLVDACREVSQAKQVILTTYSPAIVDRVGPDDIWVVSKPEAETSVSRLVDVDPVVKSDWEEGHFELADYLETGLVPGSVPTLLQ